VSIIAGISATKTGFELVKGVVEKLKRPDVDAGEVSARLLELQGLMLEAREALSAAHDEIAQLKKAIAAFDQTAALEKLMVYDQSVYWKRGSDSADLERHPYCTTCWDKERRLSHLKPGATRGTWTCQIDRSTYQTEEYRRERLGL
jgi:hypothetical protein